MTQNVLIELSALLLLQFSAAAQEPPAVAIKGGEIRGSTLISGGAVFKGIPFAAPPVGDLRWREPMPVKPWSGIRDATQFGSRCMQNGAGVSEDCLYLNVWTRNGRLSPASRSCYGFTAAATSRPPGTPENRPMRDSLKTGQRN